MNHTGLWKLLLLALSLTVALTTPVHALEARATVEAEHAESSSEADYGSAMESIPLLTVSRS